MSLKIDFLESIHLIRSLSEIQNQDRSKIAKELGLESDVQINILLNVLYQDGLNISEIAERTFWHISSITIHVQKLVKKGFLRTEKSLEDGRVNYVYLTEQGRKVANDIFSKKIFETYRFRMAFEDFSNSYSPNVVKLFIECLNFLAASLHGGEKVKWIKDTEKLMNVLHEKEE